MGAMGKLIAETSLAAARLKVAERSDGRLKLMLAAAQAKNPATGAWSDLPGLLAIRAEITARRKTAARGALKLAA